MKRDNLWEKVKRDFSEDLALQQGHFARLKIHEEARGSHQSPHTCLFFVLWKIYGVTVCSGLSSLSIKESGTVPSFKIFLSNKFLSV